jgi:bifunctional non-homologous end joining protein LigD
VGQGAPGHRSKGKSWKDIDKGHLHFTLEGRADEGRVAADPAQGQARARSARTGCCASSQDELAEEGDPLVEHGLTSVLTGRAMGEIAADTKGEFSLKGVRGDKFTEVMAKAAKRNKAVAKGGARKAPGKPPKFLCAAAGDAGRRRCRRATAGCTRSSSTGTGR